MVKVESDRVSRVNRGRKKKKERERQTVSEFISWEKALVGVTRETVSWLTGCLAAVYRIMVHTAKKVKAG